MGDSILGAWKLNLAKSKFDPGPSPMSRTNVFEPWETDGVTMKSTVMLADGSRIAGDLCCHYDGRDYKVTGVPGLDTIALKRVGADTVEATYKRDGTVVERGTYVVSENGNLLTVTVTGKNAKDQQVHNVWVYDKE